MTERDAPAQTSANIALSQDLLDAIDREARARREKRSVIVRDALRLWLRLNATQPYDRAS